MKKILFAFIAVAALALTGCEKKGLDIMSLDVTKLDNTEFKCWTFTISNSGISDGTMYAWDTESNVVRTLQEAYKQSGNKAVVSYAPTADGDADSCDSHNDF